MAWGQARDLNSTPQHLCKKSDVIVCMLGTGNAGTGRLLGLGGCQPSSSESPCLSDFSAASEPATLESTFSLCPSPATLQPKLKPISQGFSSDYPRHAGKWTLVSGDQNRTYNKGGPSCGQQQWGEGGAHRVTSQKDCILGAAASSSRAWRHQTCQLKRPMNI